MSRFHRCERSDAVWSWLSGLTGPNVKVSLFINHGQKFTIIRNGYESHRNIIFRTLRKKICHVLGYCGGTRSIVKVPLSKSRTRTYPASSPTIISAWFGCKTALLMGALFLNSFWHFKFGKSQIRTVPSVEAVKSQWQEDWKARDVTFPVCPWRMFLAWIFAVDA